MRTQTLALISLCLLLAGCAGSFDPDDHSGLGPPPGGTAIPSGPTQVSNPDKPS